MFLRFLFLIVACVASFGATPVSAQFPFGNAFAPTFTFTETYRETVGRDPNDPVEYIDRIESRLFVKVRASLAGIDSSYLDDNDTTASIDVGNLIMDVDFDAGIRSTANGFKVIKFFYDGTDPATFEMIEDACKVTIKYNATEVIFELEAIDVSDDYSIQALDEAGTQDIIDKSPVLVDFVIGDYGFTGRTCYVSGEAGFHEQDLGNGESASGLADVELEGELDVVAPTVSVKTPNGRDTVSTNPVTVTGIYEEDFFIKSVKLQVNGGEFLPATLTPTGAKTGTWTVSGVTFVPGRNILIARAEDQDGNVRDSDIVKPLFSVQSNLTVNANGSGGGKVTAGFIDPVIYRFGTLSAPKVAELTVAEKYTIQAIPAADSIFAGWTSNAALTPAQAASAKLTFDMAENMTLTAKFIINPFTPVQGKYAGLLSSEDVMDHGLLTGSLNPKGVFSLKAKIGKLTIPIKGQFSPTGTFTKQIKVKGVTYSVTLALNISGTGAQEITGTITGGTIDTSLVASRGSFKKSNPVPAELVGSYNVLLPESVDNTDANYPVGVGFGRVSIKATGKVKFVGKLADGSPLSVGATLSAERTWPLFGALYGKTGSIAGIITVDPTNGENDMSGAATWYKPAGAKPKNVHAAGFNGVSNLVGAKFTKPTAGELSFLQSTSGQGQVTFVTTSSSTSMIGTLDAQGKFNVTAPAESPIQNVKCSVSNKTGLVNGTFQESGATRKFQGLVVRSKLNQMGAFFISNGVSGAVLIEEPPVAD